MNHHVDTWTEPRSSEDQPVLLTAEPFLQPLRSFLFCVSFCLMYFFFLLSLFLLSAEIYIPELRGFPYAVVPGYQLGTDSGNPTEPLYKVMWYFYATCAYSRTLSHLHVTFNA